MALDIYKGLSLQIRGVKVSLEFPSLGSVSFGICKKTRLSFYKRNPAVKQSRTAWVSNKSEAVVFKDTKCSLEFFGSFWVKPKMNINPVWNGCICNQHYKLT